MRWWIFRWMRSTIIKNTRDAEATIHHTDTCYCNYRRCIAEGSWRVSGFDGQACWRHYGALLRDVAKSARPAYPELTHISVDRSGSD